MKATNKIECPRCNGSKYITGFSHIENGRCFLCGGAGVVSANTTDRKATGETKWLVHLSTNVNNPFSCYVVANLVRCFEDGGFDNIEHYRHNFESTDNNTMQALLGKIRTAGITPEHCNASPHWTT